MVFREIVAVASISRVVRPGRPLEGEFLSAALEVLVWQQKKLQCIQHRGLSEVVLATQSGVLVHADYGVGIGSTVNKNQPVKFVYVLERVGVAQHHQSLVVADIK
ncbi:hypothetical protein D3C85_1455640 [compost metagenome]